jgi:MFS transporter, ACS family, pantothenate transporter
MQYIIGSWYRKDELAKRSCLFHAMGNVGSMMSGYLMAGAHNLDGIHGFHGWQWLFITNTIVSLPIAISGFFFLPDLPEITDAWYLSAEEIQIAKKRMELEGRAPRAPYTRAKFRKIFSSWHIYTLVLLYIIFNNGNGGNSQPAFAIWLKEQGYGIKEVNIYPTIVEVIAIITTLLYAWTSDSLFRGARWPAMVFSGVVKIVAYISLAIWTVPVGLIWASYLLCGFGGGISGLTFAWAHEICGEDNEERALVTGAMNEFAYVFQAFLPLLIVSDLLFVLVNHIDKDILYVVNHNPQDRTLALRGPSHNPHNIVADYRHSGRKSKHQDTPRATRPWSCCR